MTQLHSIWIHANTFQNIACSAHHLYLCATTRIQQGSGIICKLQILLDLRSLTHFHTFYITPCSHYYAHFDCWLHVSQSDYTCHICNKRYNSGHMSPLRAPPVVTPNYFGIYVRMLADFHSYITVFLSSSLQAQNPSHIPPVINSTCISFIHRLHAVNVHEIYVYILTVIYISMLPAMYTHTILFFVKS